MTISGTIIELLPMQSGTSKAGKEWKKQEFVLETQGQYPKQVCITLFGNKLDELGSHLQVGNVVDVDFDLSSTAWTNKDGKKSFITNVNAYAIRLQQAVATTISSNPTPMEQSQFLMNNAPIPEPVNPFNNPQNEANDLPF